MYEIDDMSVMYGIYVMYGMYVLYGMYVMYGMHVMIWYVCNDLVCMK